MAGRTDQERDAPTALAGTDAERRAANALAAVARDRRLDATVDSFSIWPRAAAAQALLLLVAIAGGLVATGAHAAGTAIVAVAALLFVLDSTGTAQPVRHLLGRRVSQNVELDPHPGDVRAATVLVVAAVDIPRSDRPLLRLRDPWRATVAALALLSLACILGLTGVESDGLLFVSVVVLIVLVPAYLDAALAAPATPTDGAARAAVALCDDLDLEHFRVRGLLTGAGDAGMRRWLRANRRALGRESTAIVSLRLTGNHSLAHTTRQGAVIAQRSHRDLLRLAREVAEDLGGAAAVTDHRTTTASRALARRLPAIELRAAPGDAEAPDRLRTFARELIERLDADLGPSLRDGGRG